MATASSVRVGLRVRPLLSNERHQGISVEPNGENALEFKGMQTFTYDYVFGMDVSQQELYNQTAAPLLKSFMEGYNITLIAYGQTGSGKTFTMGSSDEAASGDSEGLIPRFLVDLFENLHASPDDGDVATSASEKRLQASWRIKASFLEIYGEDVYDLTAAAPAAAACAPSLAGLPTFAMAAALPSDRPSLPVREDETGRVFVQGLHEIEVASTEEALAVLSQGSKNRITGATAMNAGSSRSHAVYTVQLEQTLQSSTSADDRHQMTSKLTFVDLAGSERLKRTGAEGQRLREGIQINSGLFNLGQVINALADDQRIKHGNKVGFVPYRNSKLTHLLKDALGGNSQTLFLACVSPAESNESETLSTLNYARQARNIQNKPVVNMDKTQLELRQLKYAVKAWMMKAIGQKFAAAASAAASLAGAGMDGSSNGGGLGGLMSPLPCVSPAAPGGKGTKSSVSAAAASSSTGSGFDDELSALLTRPEVQDYIAAVNAAINDKLAGGGLPSPRKVRLSALPGASPFRVAGAAGGKGRPGLQGVARKLGMAAAAGSSGDGWDEVPVGGAPRSGGMPAIREDGDDGAAGASDDAAVATMAWVRAAAGASLDSVGAGADPEETERLVTRMLEMISKEKAGLDTDGLGLADQLTDGPAGAGAPGSEQAAQQAAAIVEMDRAIAEKEEILTKLLDTVRGYAAMKSDFERLLESIGTLEAERQQLEAELEKAKLQAQEKTGGGVGSGGGGGNGAAVERMKDRFLKVKEELRTMREERKNKENAYRLMQRESKQCDALQKELAKLKESKVAAQRQQRLQAQEMQKLKKDQQLMLTSLKKNDVKKQQLMNTLKSELVKRDRVLGHKDREIGRINSKLKACEEHITQLLKMQTRNRGKGAGSGVGGIVGASGLTAAEAEHLATSKAMLDSLVGERVERRRNNALFERKSAKLRELNADLAREAEELEALAARRRELLRAEGKPETFDDADDDVDDAAHGQGGEDGDEDPRATRLAVQQQMRQAESTVDRITRELDLLNTDLEDLAASMGTGAPGDASGADGAVSAHCLSWEDIGKEVIGGLSLAQCQALLWLQIGEKAALHEQARLTDLGLLEAREEVEAANARADGGAAQLAALRGEMQRRLLDAEKQRVSDVWALLKAQQAPGGTEPAAPADRDLATAAAATSDRVALLRAQELEAELEACLAAEEHLRDDNAALAAQVQALETAALRAAHLGALARRPDGAAAGTAAGADEEDEATRVFFQQLSQHWDALGVAAADRSVTVDRIREAEMTARVRALRTAERDVAVNKAREARLRRSLHTICDALGQAPHSFLPPVATATAGKIDEEDDADRTALRQLPLLGRVAALQAATDAATAVMTVRSSTLEGLKEQLLTTMSEMWLDAGQLPDCLKKVLQVDFHEAAGQAAAMGADDAKATAAAAGGGAFAFDDEDGEDVGVGSDGAIATVMIHSAVAVAEQLRRCGLRLRDEDTRRWERELRALNVTRATLTTQLVAARGQAVLLCDALGIADATALSELQSKAAADGASSSSSSGALQEQAEGAALNLVLTNSASNPPGSEPLLLAVRRLVIDLEGARDARARVEAPARQLAALFHAAMAVARDDTSSSDGSAAPPAADSPLQAVLTSLRAMPATAVDAREVLAARLGALLEHVIVTAGGGMAAADVGSEVQAKVAAVIAGAAATVPSAGHALADMEARLVALVGAAASSREGWLQEAAHAVEAGWKAVKESQIPKSKPSSAEPASTSSPSAPKAFAKEALRQVAALSAELARLTAVADTFRDLQRLDAQLVRHVREMEDFEAASKQDRMKLLSGNSKALVEEEKFRKAGKRKYEQVTERIIALAEQLEQLTAGSGDALVAAAALDIGPLDLSSLSAQSHTVLKGKVHWQEKLELMHLHTTTHGTRRWSGGLPTPPGPGPATASGPPPAPAHTVAAPPVAPAAPSATAATAKEKDMKGAAPAPAASMRAAASTAAASKARPPTASAAALNPFAAATTVSSSSSSSSSSTMSTASAVTAASLGPAVRPKDAVLNSNTAHNSKATPAATTGVTKKPAAAAAISRKAVSFSTKENADANL